MKTNLFKLIATLFVAALSLGFTACGDDDVDDNGGGKKGDNGHEYVDLGLPSGLKWATCNIGAETPEGYGSYFAWGETTPKSEYSENSYTYEDKREKLASANDAAHVNWGGKWRMPTIADFKELRDNTTREWVESYNDTGVNGYLFTAKNGNQIFLPTAGFCYDSHYFSSGVHDAGERGYYWTSIPYKGNGHSAYSLLFWKGRFYIDSDSYETREAGQPIRPVRP